MRLRLPKQVRLQPTRSRKRRLGNKRSTRKKSRPPQRSERRGSKQPKGNNSRSSMRGWPEASLLHVHSPDHELDSATAVFTGSHPHHCEKGIDYAKKTSAQE